MRAPIPKASARSPLVLAARAREMRFAATPSEARLWEAIRGRRMGVGFRRQVPIAGKYIADFVAAEARLVVEVDGGYHGKRGTADARRDEALRRAGWRVLRIPAELVLRELPAALVLVRAALAAPG
jgi:very-short-patch-repair endonuclease